MDIGSGDKYYEDLFPNKVNLDIDPERKPDVVGDARNLPFQDNEFDNILCLEVLEHINQPQKAIAEMQRVLKPGGKIILTTRFIFPLHDVPGDYFRYTKYGLQELFKDWEILELKTESASFETIAILLQRLIFQINYQGNKFIKVILLIFIKLFLFLNRFIKTEFGDIKKEKKEKNILTSGYYLVAINKKL